MSSTVVLTRTLSKQEPGCDSLIQFINRVLTEGGYPQPNRIKIRFHEVLTTFTNQAPECFSKRITQDLMMHYQDVELLHEDVEIVAMNLFPDRIHEED